MIRQKELREACSLQCRGCPFLLDEAPALFRCLAPGNTCIHREIKGVPGRYVGDVLEDAGVISGYEPQVLTKARRVTIITRSMLVRALVRVFFGEVRYSPDPSFEWSARRLKLIVMDHPERFPSWPTVAEFLDGLGVLEEGE